MNKTISILFYFLAISIGTYAQTTPAQIKWKRLRTVEEVRVELNKHIHIGSSATELESFLKSQKLERFGKVDNYYFAFAKTKSRSFWIAKEWMLKFYLGEDNKLSSIKIEAALTGP